MFYLYLYHGGTDKIINLTLITYTDVCTRKICTYMFLIHCLCYVFLFAHLYKEQSSTDYLLRKHRVNFNTVEIVVFNTMYPYKQTINYRKEIDLPSGKLLSYTYIWIWISLGFNLLMHMRTTKSHPYTLTLYFIVRLHLIQS